MSKPELGAEQAVLEARIALQSIKEQLNKLAEMIEEIGRIAEEEKDKNDIPFEVGQAVYVGEADGKSINRWGIIVWIDKELSHYLVHFPGWTDGHGGEAPGIDYIFSKGSEKSHWWVTRQDLHLHEPEEV